MTGYIMLIVSIISYMLSVIMLGVTVPQGGISLDFGVV